MEKIKYKVSSGNVFEDLGFDKEEAGELLERSRLMIALTRHLRALSKSQRDIGQMLGIGQSRVSDLMKGKAKLFSLDMIFQLAQRAGLRVQIQIGNSPARSPGRQQIVGTSKPLKSTSWGNTSSNPQRKYLRVLPSGTAGFYLSQLTGGSSTSVQDVKYVRPFASTAPQITARLVTQSNEHRV